MSNLTANQMAQIAFVQQNFRRLRSICEWSASDVADVLGITRQTVNNVELGKTQLSILQYLGFASMLDWCRKNRPDVAAYLNVCLTHFPGSGQGVPADLLSSWFSSFPRQFPETRYLKNAFENIQSVNLIEHIAERCKIFITPDIFLRNRKCLEDLGAAALQFKNPLIVPAKAFAQIEPSLSEDCRDFVTACRRDGRIKFYGSEQDASLAEVITTQMLRLRTKYPLCLVTGNRVLASDVQALDALQSVSGYDITTARIIDDSYLELWDRSVDDWEGLITPQDDAIALGNAQAGEMTFTDSLTEEPLRDTSDVEQFHLPITANGQSQDKIPCRSEMTQDEEGEIAWRLI